MPLKMEYSPYGLLYGVGMTAKSMLNQQLSLRRLYFCCRSPPTDGGGFVIPSASATLAKLGIGGEIWDWEDLEDLYRHGIDAHQFPGVCRLSAFAGRELRRSDALGHVTPPEPC